MIDRRIRYPKEKIDFINSMLKNSKGPFDTQAQVIAFAAAFAAKNGQKVAFTKSGEPIRYETFDREKLDILIDLLAIVDTQNHEILADNESSIDQRITIFEEYANCGLSLLEEALKGEVSYTKPLLALIRDKPEVKEDDDIDLIGLLN